MIEFLVAVAIVVTIISLGLFISFDFYKSYAFRSEKNVIVSVLQRARSQSLNNINQTRHGARFDNNDGLKYVIFECKSTNPQCADYANADNSKDILFDSSWGISLDSPTLPFDIIFDQISGNCINCSSPNTIITISSGNNHYNININNEGRIDW